MFPILMDQEEKKRLSELVLLYGSEIPDQLPIAFINQYRKQIEKNQGQTIEKLIEIGGIHPRELVPAMYGMNLQIYFGKMENQLSDEQTVFALNMIRMKLNEFKRET